MGEREPVDIEDRASLEAYLRDSGRVGASERLDIKTLAGGVSNKTVLVGRPSGEAWVLKQALPKLRTAIDWYSDPARIRREALGLLWLLKLAPAGAITPLIFEDVDQFLLAMRAVPQPHENWKSMLLAGDVRSDHVRQFGALLGQIHRGAITKEELSDVFGDRTFFESLRVEPYYAYTAGRIPDAERFIDTLINDTRANRFTLVHGDYSPKNVLVYDDKLILLDHEVIHWGDGAFDVGFGLCHLLSKAHHQVEMRDSLKRAAVAFWNAYRDACGETAANAIEPRAVRHALGCLLARVAGRSPLEYLDEGERRRQAKAVVALMQEPPATVDVLAERFVQQIDSN